MTNNTIDCRHVNYCQNARNFGSLLHECIARVSHALRQSSDTLIECPLACECVALSTAYYGLIGSGITSIVYA